MLPVHASDPQTIQPAKVRYWITSGYPHRFGLNDLSGEFCWSVPRAAMSQKHPWCWVSL